MQFLGYVSDLWPHPSLGLESELIPTARLWSGQQS